MDFGLNSVMKTTYNALFVAAACSLSFLSKEIKYNSKSGHSIHMTKPVGTVLAKDVSIHDVLMWWNLALGLSEPELRDENMNVDDILARVVLICQIAHGQFQYRSQWSN